MRVLIDTTYARRAPFSGTAVYIERVCAELSRRHGVELIEVANRRRRPPAGGGLGSARNLASDLWWSGLELSRLARRTGADLIHHPLPALSLAASVPQVVTIADLSFERLPDCFDRAFRIYAHQAHRAAALGASAVVCMSETTASDVQALWGVRSDRIVVAPLGPGQDLPASRAPQPGYPGHFLYVGDAEPRKNLPVLLAAYDLYRRSAEPPLELVLAGSASARAAGVRMEARPTPARLSELYLGAAALVHTSLYEGFGLTPVEAMSIGTPVIAANSPGVREICADAVRYADPRQPASFAAAMGELAGNPTLRRELSERGRRRAGEFSWSSCASAHLDAYSLAVGRP